MEDGKERRLKLRLNLTSQSSMTLEYSLTRTKPLKLSIRYHPITYFTLISVQLQLANEFANEEEFNEFKTILKERLPVVFRINENVPNYKNFLQKLKDPSSTLR